MRAFASPSLRLFLCAWIVYSAYFATNVVREHYPAFALIDHGTFKVDEYEGFHPDIFKHRDGHCYIGNQVAASVVTAVPLLAFKPVLDILEEKGKERAAAQAARPAADDGYRTEYKNRQVFLAKVRAQGLDLKFGGATVVTSVFLMAPLSALMVVLVFGLMRRAGVPFGRATALAALFAFGTPVFYRASYLNHNVILMLTVFLNGVLLWPKANGELPVSVKRRFWAGFFAGSSLALDYAGVVPLMVFWIGMLVARRRAGYMNAFKESIPYILGSVPPVAFLCWTQWAMYGHPILPGQYWMPAVNYTDRGWRGYAVPGLDTMARQFFDLDWGLLAFAPFLLLGFLPPRRPDADGLIVPRRERRIALAFVWTLIVFCAGNQYSLMQWNSGFRYLLPVVPFLFLIAADHLSRWPRVPFAILTAAMILHQWVLAMVRFTPVDFGDERKAVVESWHRVFHDGLQFPWLNVLRQTTSDPHSILQAAWIPYALVLLLGGALYVLWPKEDRAAIRVGGT